MTFHSVARGAPYVRSGYASHYLSVKGHLNGSTVQSCVAYSTIITPLTVIFEQTAARTASALTAGVVLLPLNPLFNR